MLDEAFTRALLSNGESTHYNFGWRIDDYHGHRRIRHGGSWVGFSETIGVNSILRWIREAGREAVLVLNRQREDFERNNRFDSTYSELTFKIAYTFRF
jgi:hypothetical protein